MSIDIRYKENLLLLFLCATPILNSCNYSLESMGMKENSESNVFSISHAENDMPSISLLERLNNRDNKELVLQNIENGKFSNPELNTIFQYASEYFPNSEGYQDLDFILAILKLPQFQTEEFIENELLPKIPNYLDIWNPLTSPRVFCAKYKLEKGLLFDLFTESKGFCVNLETTYFFENPKDWKSKYWKSYSNKNIPPKASDILKLIPHYLTQHSHSHIQNLIEITPNIANRLQALMINTLFERQLSKGLYKSENGSIGLCDGHNKYYIGSLFPRECDAVIKISREKLEARTYLEGRKLKETKISQKVEPIYEFKIRTPYVGSSQTKKVIPTAIVIKVYGGGDSKKSKIKPFDSDSLFTDTLCSYLLGEEILAGYLNLADLWYNEKTQFNMNEEVFNAVLDGIKNFVDDFRNEKLEDEYGRLVKEFNPNIPIILFGQSFGGTVIANYLAKYPGTIDKAIIFNGGLYSTYDVNYSRNFVEHIKLNESKLSKIEDPIFLCATSHDNNVSLKNSIITFAEEMNKLGKGDLIVPYVTTEGSFGLDDPMSIGHGYRQDDLALFNVNFG